MTTDQPAAATPSPPPPRDGRASEPDQAKPTGSEAAPAPVREDADVATYAAKPSPEGDSSGKPDQDQTDSSKADEGKADGGDPVTAPAERRGGLGGFAR